MTRRHCVPGVGPVVVRRGRHGTQTVTTRRLRRNGERSAMTRCPRGGTQTVLTRRSGRGGRGTSAPGALVAALRRPCFAAPDDAVKGWS